MATSVKMSFSVIFDSLIMSFDGDLFKSSEFKLVFV